MIVSPPLPEPRVPWRCPRACCQVAARLPGPSGRGRLPVPRSSRCGPRSGPAAFPPPHGVSGALQEPGAPAGQRDRHVRGARGQRVRRGVVLSRPLAVRLPELRRAAGHQQGAPGAEVPHPALTRAARRAGRSRSRRCPLWPPAPPPRHKRASVTAADPESAPPPETRLRPLSRAGAARRSPAGHVHALCFLLRTLGLHRKNTLKKNSLCFHNIKLPFP